MVTPDELLRYEDALRLHQSGDLIEAQRVYLRLLETDPGHAEALHGLGVIAYQRGDWTRAVDLMRQALTRRPDHAEAQKNLAAILSAMGRSEEARSLYEEASRNQAATFDAALARADSLRSLGRHDEAETAYRELLGRTPRLAAAHAGLGLTLLAQGRPAEAEIEGRRAVAEHATSAVAHNALARALCALDRSDEAIDHFREALRLDSHTEAWHDLGTAYKLVGRVQDALACFDESLWLLPTAASTHVNRATLLLLLCDFERGWPEYEWRWRVPELAPRSFPQPLWDGGPLGGRTILLHAEQGLGDTIQFVRYAPLVRRLGGRVVLLAAPRLHALLASCPGIDELADPTVASPPFDVHAPLLSLPGLLRTRADTIPADTPYLHADPSLVVRWRQRLASLDGYRVGVAWQGNPRHPEDRRRSFPLALLEPLARLPGAALVSLQRMPEDSSASPATCDWPLVEPGPDLDQAAAFADTAAIMKNLDLVVTADTAVAHLAGALGVPVWIALHHVPDWRWQLGRDDSPWYPSARLFRQSSPGDYRPVMQAMAERLAADLSGRPQAMKKE